jgi:hypothetical protein
MIRLKGIESLPPADRVKIYSEMAIHFRAMGALAYSDGTRLTFEEMANEMNECAEAVTVFAP